jgi:hypothetical protein
VTGGVVGAEIQLSVDGLHDADVVVSQQQRTVPAVVVHVLIAVDIPFARTLGAIHVDGIRIQLPGVVHDTARQHLARPRCQHLRSGSSLAIGGDDC